MQEFGARVIKCIVAQLYSQANLSHATSDLTPYEEFLRQNLEDEKRKAAKLDQDYAKAGSMKKMQIKRELDLVNQNIQIVSSDLAKYASGLHWLREPSKERDEKAENLKPVPLEAIAGAVRATAPAQAKTVAAPVVGKPISQPVQNPAQPPPKVGNAPQVGTPIGQKKNEETSS